jgi:hypothetical protein
MLSRSVRVMIHTITYEEESSIFPLNKTEVLYFF